MLIIVFAQAYQQLLLGVETAISLEAKSPLLRLVVDLLNLDNKSYSKLCNVTPDLIDFDIDFLICCRLVAHLFVQNVVKQIVIG